MTSERAQAYGRVMSTIEDLGPTKLQAGEIERIRDAADTLLFSETPPADVLADVRELTHHLADTGRWTDERAAALLADLEACGPLTRAV